MAIDVDLINYIHQYVSDREIFDIEMLWLLASIFTASAPPKLTEKMPSWLMKSLNILTLHWSASKNSDIRGKRKF